VGRSRASPIGFPRFKRDTGVDAFCEALVEAAGVLLLPGSVYDEPRHVRFGFGRANMPEALQRLDDYLETHPVA
jgi:aspartate/methionine/tyrosine aminotransferase